MTRRALAFAAAVRRRYGSAHVRRRPIGLVFRRLFATTAYRLGTVRSSTAFVDARRLSFTASIVRKIEQRVERIQRSSLVDRTKHTDLVERLLERSLRIERLPGSARPAPAPSRSPALSPVLLPCSGRPTPPIAPPSQVATIVLRRTVVERQSAPPAHSPQEASRPSGLEPAVPQHPMPASAGAVDVHRLADEVLDAIDRKIVAHRERHGRV